MIRTILEKIKRLRCHSSSSRLIAYYRSLGIQIGEGTYLRPKTCEIDTSRPSLVSIGRNCYMNEHFTLLTHDWVTRVFIYSARDFINSSGKVSIGNNVSFGEYVTVLKGVTIGDNCFIGACSVVNKDIPSNSIAVGIPCRVIMTLDDYYQKRKQKCESEAFEFARSIQERFGRKPVPADFREEFPFFVDGDDVAKYPEIPIQAQCGPAFDRYIKEHKAPYRSFDEFLKAAGIK